MRLPHLAQRSRVSIPVTVDLHEQRLAVAGRVPPVLEGDVDDL
jgi:hypothetical protein